MTENGRITREKNYRIVVIILSVALIILMGLYLRELLQPDAPSMVGEFQWFSLMSNYDDAYTLIQNRFGDVISESDFLAFQSGGTQGSLIYPVLLYRNAESGTVFLFRFYEDPNNGKLVLHKVKALPDSLSQELTDTLFMHSEE